MTTLPDNRLRLSSTLTDFVNDVGITGQDHDAYPPPQGQARYDHMRMYLIALLSQQSSHSEPTEYRDGTPWFDLDTNTLKIRSDNAWLDYADVIPIGDVTLSEWRTIIDDTIDSLSSVRNYLGNVDSEAEMLALSGNSGDWCARSDTGTVWILTGPSGVIGSWLQLNYPTGPAVSTTLYDSDGTYNYFGGLVGSAWRVKRLTIADPTIFLTATVVNNASLINLSSAWSNRTTLNYV